MKFNDINNWDDAFHRIAKFTPSHPKYRISHSKFWQWKLSRERKGKSHILDAENIGTTVQLFDVLDDPVWGTYDWSPYKAGRTNHSIKYKHDLKTTFSRALENIADDYNEIRNVSLLQLNHVNWEALEHIWCELGRVKTVDGVPNPTGEYFIIAVCKPLMFLWGQTPAFDSQNRGRMRSDNLLPSKLDKEKWTFYECKKFLEGLSQQIQGYKNLCEQKSIELYGCNDIVPYGRFIDYLYYEKGKGYKTRYSK